MDVLIIDPKTHWGDDIITNGKTVVVMEFAPMYGIRDEIYQLSSVKLCAITTMLKNIYDKIPKDINKKYIKINETVNIQSNIKMYNVDNYMKNILNSRFDNKIIYISTNAFASVSHEAIDKTLSYKSCGYIKKIFHKSTSLPKKFTYSQFPHFLKPAKKIKLSGVVLPARVEDATLNIYPIDKIIDQCIDTGWITYYERIRVLINFFQLINLSISQITLFMWKYIIDMNLSECSSLVQSVVPTFAGGRSTKISVTSSTYITTHFKHLSSKNDYWKLIWDSLYWNYTYKYKKNICVDPHINNIFVKAWNNKPQKEQKIFLGIADKFIKMVNND